MKDLDILIFLTMDFHFHEFRQRHFSVENIALFKQMMMNGSTPMMNSVPVQQPVETTYPPKQPTVPTAPIDMIEKGPSDDEEDQVFVPFEIKRIRVASPSPTRPSVCGQRTKSQAILDMEAEMDIIFDQDVKARRPVRYPIVPLSF